MLKSVGAKLLDAQLLFVILRMSSFCFGTELWENICHVSNLLSPKNIRHECITMYDENQSYLKAIEIKTNYVNV